MSFWNRSFLRSGLVCAVLCTVMALGQEARAQATATATPSVGAATSATPATGHGPSTPNTPNSSAAAANESAKAREGEGRDLSWLPADLIPKLVSSATTGNSSSGTAAPAEGDPVLRFLNDKGLLPSAKPVLDMAQQVRSKATDVASDLVISAMTFLGVPYRRGGSSVESGFDCSGFTRHVFERTVGMILPRRAAEQANSPDLVPVAKGELKPGDLVFFNTLRNTFSHVGIYIGDNKFIHSPRAGGKVRVEDIREAYWQQHYDGARRAPGLNGARAAAAAANAAAN